MTELMKTGRKGEVRVARTLRKLGYVVTYLPKNNPTFDIVAVSRTAHLLVQVKHYSGRRYSPRPFFKHGDMINYVYPHNAKRLFWYIDTLSEHQSILLATTSGFEDITVDAL